MMVPSVHSTSHTIFDRLDEHGLAEPAAAARVASHAVLLAKLVPGIVAILPSLGVDVHARRRKIGRARVAAYLVGHLDAVALAGLFALCSVAVVLAAGVYVDDETPTTPATRHSVSTHRHSEVRRSDLPVVWEEGRSTLVLRGSANDAGGATAALSLSDQLGRSCGSRAAVQSRPIHHRWFS